MNSAGPAFSSPPPASAAWASASALGTALVLELFGDVIAPGRRRRRDRLAIPATTFISPGIIITPLANDELTAPRGKGYRRMI